MMPLLPPGTWIVVDSGSTFQSLKPGQLLALANPTGQLRMVHRLVELRGRMLKTSGDHSVFRDPWISMEALLGVVVVYRRPSGDWFQSTPPSYTQQIQPLLSKLYQFRMSRLPRLVLTNLAGEKHFPAMKLNNNIEWHRIGPQVLIYQSNEDQIHVLNETASLIWEALQSGKTNSELVKTLHLIYPDADVQILQRDVEDTLQQFGQKNLLGNAP
ncbi:MAG: PqqD family peptide modification chaperone [Candidatus Sumerlaeia bacterium]|nr:PqqD family peptide modification chaperone [Candidatus Sumerlaeia bacterium]